MKLYLSIFIFCLANILCTSLGYAKKLAPRLGEIDRYLSFMDLSEKQEEKAKRLIIGARKKMIRLESKKAILEIDLQVELDRSVPNRLKLFNMSDGLSLIEGRFLKVKLNVWIELQLLLSKSQRKQINLLRRQKNPKKYEELIRPFLSR